MATIAPTGGHGHLHGDRLRAAAVRVDWLLLCAVAGLTIISLLVIGKATEGQVAGNPRFYLDRQLLFVGIGLVLMLVASRINLEWATRWAWPILVTLMASLVVVFAIGGVTRGARSWFALGPFNLQPSEFGKIMLMIVLVGLAIERADSIGTWRFTLFLTGVALMPTLAVFVQPDLGTALVYGAILFGILFLVGVPWTHFAVYGSVLAVLTLAALWILPTAGVEVLQPHQMERLTAFVGADRDTNAAGYQLDQSKIAIGSGGPVGKGLNGATQTSNGFLPEYHNDFIFAVVGEMFGFVGAAVVIALFGLILWRGLRVMTRASSQVDMLIAGAIIAMFIFQVFVNIGMTVGIMPITGIPLPLMSYGGSHTLATFIAIGLLLGIHRRRSAIPG
ncbi:MAG TPA: rod shape-determining protein RodA [Miltoncostaeaceae bacterium]|nr:rod shape-determining protein RodA [Miltoncostaeaceae bacterium]